MIDDVTIRRKTNGNIYIAVPHFDNGIIGNTLDKDNIYKTPFIYRQTYHQHDIIEYLINNNFIIVLNQEIHNNNFSKYIFQLTLKSILRVV